MSQTSKYYNFVGSHFRRKWRSYLNKSHQILLEKCILDSEELLTSFRQEWRKELENSLVKRDTSGNQAQSRQNVSQTDGSFNQTTSRENHHDGIHSEIEIEAADLFNKGVQLEQNGQLYESIRYYRKAISLVPDIELRVHHRNMQDRDEDYSEEEEERVMEDPDCKDLVSRFENLLSMNQPICQPQFPQDAPHLSCLPAEMLDKILCWVIGKELDFESLERAASVCRGLFLICRKPDMWRRACIRVWGINTGELSSYKSWREMFIWRPRPRFNGCYISKMTYFRSGENSFQDLSYQPWHIVCYYRYLRFFPRGHVLMLTSSEDPQVVVGHLKKLDTKYPQVLAGHFRIHGSALTMLFRKTSGKINNRLRNRRKGQGTTDVSDTTFQMELELKPVRGRPHWQLVWRCYSIVSSFKSGSHTTSVVNVADQNNFPPLAFSKVKSFTAESEEPFL